MSPPGSARSGPPGELPRGPRRRADDPDPNPGRAVVDGPRLGIVPPRASTPVRRGTLTRDAARREAVDTLTIASAVAAYAAGQIGNGLSPQQARQAAIEAAAELETVAGTLRRLARTTRPDPAGRRALVAELSASGWSQRRIAAEVGVCRKRYGSTSSGPAAFTA